ncbi:MAG: hypothetical protein EP298_05415 [Gammaproteobacteria bacterium]|nr:MAG: hypothetical protein EP298_05415 [Gammaproteobacteria bacterium]UTW43235.1 hypothetical protein KFE69_03575 [bacterium SCSIO 12844]
MKFNITNKMFETLEFAKYLKRSTECSQPVQRIIKMLPSNISTFSFFRLFPNGECNMILPKPIRALYYAKKEFWKSDITMNFNCNLPIYDRRKFLEPDKQKQYDQFISTEGGLSSIAISHKFHSFKDTFFFIFTNPVSSEDYCNIYSLLNSISISFYAAAPIFQASQILPKTFHEYFIYKDIEYDFDPFSELATKFNLTKTQMTYLLPLALHMPLNYFAETFHRSRRTVEKYIDDLRSIFDIETKFELCQFLTSYYIHQVKLWCNANENIVIKDGKIISI